MSRKVKNIISVGLIIIIFGSILFTMNYAKDNIKSTSSDNIENKNGEKPPEPPSGEMQDGTTMPELPDVEMQNGDRMENPPEPPSGEMNPPEMHEIGETTTDLDLTTPYYIIFALESIALSFISIYLILSKFNKQTFIETLDTNKERIIFGLCLVVLACSLTYAACLITKKCFLDNNSVSNLNFDSNNGWPPSSNNGNSDVTYSSETNITTDTTIESGEYNSDVADQNAILVDGEISANISNITVNKTGDSDGGDNTSFYGTNSAILAKSGSTLNLNNINVVTNATGANGVFSYGGSATTNNSNSDGTIVNITDSTITTIKDNSGGIMTTGGGIMNATNLNISTSGTSSAAIRTDRGGGTVVVEKGTYKTSGKGSPTIYSTANITVKDAELTSLASEGIVIEGKNSVTLENVVLTDTNNELNGQSTTYKNIFLYQSMSGDAASGNSEFTSINSTITTNKGDTLYATNTSCTISLENNTLINNDSEGNFLRAKSDSWGNSGSNGADVVLNMNNQKVNGNIVIDSISTLALNMEKESYLEGVINGENTAKSISLKLDTTSTIKLTGDSFVTNLENEDTSYSNIDFNGYNLYVNGNSIN